jgi:adhesin/invasin
MKDFLLVGLCAISVIAPVVRGAETGTFFRVRGTEKTQATRVASGTTVVNAASFEPGVSPGGLATVFGTDLTSLSGVVLAGTNPLPTTLAGVRVIVNGIPAPIFSIAYANGEDQISFQVPYSTNVGPNAANVRVTDQGFETANVFTDSFTEDPGIFVYQGQYAVSLSGTDYSLLGPNNPTFPGEAVVLYTTGLGPLSQSLADGYGAPSNPLAYTVQPVHVILDGEGCKLLFSGLAPGFVGLYQVNFVVPGDARSGNLGLQIQSPYASSTVATLRVASSSNNPARQRAPVQ